MIATQSMMNPQVTYGDDVMSRITYVITHIGNGLESMHSSIIEGLNWLIQTITRGCGLCAEDILEVTFVGNTVMHHLLLKINPEYIGIAPLFSRHPPIDKCQSEGFGYKGTPVCKCLYPTG